MQDLQKAKTSEGESSKAKESDIMSEISKVKQDSGTSEEKNILTEAQENVSQLVNKYTKIKETLVNRIDSGLEKLSLKDGAEILSSHEDGLINEVKKARKKSLALEEEFKDELKPVAYYVKKIDIEAAGFKKVVQKLEKEEMEIDKKLKEQSDFESFKNKYEEERSEWKKVHENFVRECRQEKKDIKDKVESNLQTPSEMIESLTQHDINSGDFEE
jgi:hypothetical protein